MDGGDAAGLARSLSKRSTHYTSSVLGDNGTAAPAVSSPRRPMELVRVKSRAATAERAEMLTMSEFEQLMETDDELLQRYKTLNDYARAASNIMAELGVRAAEAEADTHGGASTLLQNAAAAVIDRHWGHLRQLQAALMAEDPQVDTVERMAKQLVEGLASGRREMDDLEAALQLDAASSEESRLWEQARDNFRIAVESISEYTLAQYGRPRPFEIEYTLVRSEQDAADNMVTLEGGDITDKDGRSIWESRCYLTGIVLQNGGHGEGRIRYHSLSTEDADRSPPAHQLLCAIRRVLKFGLEQCIPGAQSAVDILLSQDHRILDLVVPEHDHPVFQYIQCTSTNDTFKALIRSACNTFGPRPLFGVPLREDVPDSSRLEIDMAGWKFVTYAHTLQQVEYISRGLLRTLYSRVQSVPSAPPGPRVGILSENRPEWYFADMAAVLADRTTVGLHSTWSSDDIRQAIEELKIGVVFVSAKYLKICVDAVRRHTTDCVVVCFDDEEEAIDGHSTVGQVITHAALLEHEAMTQIHTQICTLAEVAQVGHAPITSLEADRFEEHSTTCTSQVDGSVYTMMLTSGSTGRSKAVVVSEGRWIREIVSQPESGPCVQLSFTPASLMADRLSVYGFMMTGGQTGFVEPSNLEAGLLSLRPTIFSAPPIYFNTLFSAYSDEIKAAADEDTRDTIEERYRRVLGGRCEIVGTGGAPVSPAVLDWMKRTFNIGTDAALVGINYGCTEVGNIATNGRLDERFRDGGPDKPCHFKLASVPELGYLISDLPWPRGEALVKTPDCVGAQYYNAADQSQAAWDDDGYYHTGDVVELQPDGGLRIIGRCKDQLKLSTGEFVSPAKIETIYDECDGILRIYIEASGLAPRVVAVVRPTASALRQAGVTLGAEDFDQKNVDQLRDAIFQQIRATASMHNLRPAEVPSAISLDLTPDDWSINNLLLTPSEKPNRNTLRDRYQDVIDSLLSSSVTQTTTVPEGVPKESVNADRIVVDADTSMEGRLYSLVVRVLGLKPSIGRDELLSHSFAELGGDSVKSMKFKTHLGGLNAVATSVPNSVTLHKPLRELAAVLQSNINGSMLSTWNQAKLGTLTFQMDRDSVLPDLQEGRIGQYDATAAQDIFLTGATGYVGAHFLASLLSATSGCQWKIRCLVRCENDADGLHRLWNVLTAHYMLSVDEACWSRVQVVPGSMNQDCFGLDGPAWEELCVHVRSVVHLAAQVAFWDEYKEARVNVVGTATILRLCVASRPRKALHHGSTLSVFGDRGTPNGSRARVIDEGFPIGVNAAASGVLQSEGYSQSKWVCEKLVSRAALHRLWRVPVCIHRIGYVSFSTCSGVANSNGWFHKLLIGVAQAGVVPPVSEAGPLVNLAPVDVVARAMVDLFMSHEQEVACADSGSPNVYHLLNAAGCTPISVFFDALEGRGLSLHRCATHQEFFKCLSQLDDSNPLYSLSPWFEHSLPAEPPFIAPQTMERLCDQCEHWRTGSTGWTVLGTDVVDRHLQRLEDTDLVPTKSKTKRAD